MTLPLETILAAVNLEEEEEEEGREKSSLKERFFPPLTSVSSSDLKVLAGRGGAPVVGSAVPRPTPHSPAPPGTPLTYHRVRGHKTFISSFNIVN